jgi:hypothetical protein
MAGNPWLRSETAPRVLALSAYAYQRGVSLLLAFFQGLVQVGAVNAQYLRHAADRLLAALNRFASVSNLLGRQFGLSSYPDASPLPCAAVFCGSPATGQKGRVSSGYPRLCKPLICKGL